MAQVIASLMAVIGADTKGFEAGSKRVKGGMSDIAKSIGGAVPASVAQFATLSGAIIGVGAAMKASMDETVKYANQVRQLSQLSGTSAEESSRFIQVLDDYKITAEEAMVATRALTKEGLTPSIDTLAKLSDEYLSLTTAQQKNEFVLKNLGRGGMQWVEILSKGSKALREQSDAVDKNLILTQKSLDAARTYELALDGLNDAMQAVKISVGNELLPVMTAFMKIILSDIQAVSVFKDVLAGDKSLTDAADEVAEIINNNGFELWGMQIGDVADQTETLTGEQYTNADASKAQADAVKQAENALRDYEDALDIASQANLDFESMSRDIANSQKQYADDHANAIEKVKDEQFKLNQALGNFGGGKKNLSDIQWEELYNNVDEAQASVKELEATWHESANNMIYDMVLVGVSAGGLLDSEQRALDEYAVKAGIKTQADIDEANRRRDIADSTIAGILQSEDVLAEQRRVDAETLRLQEQITAAQVVGSAGQEAAAMSNVTLAIDSATRSLMAMAEAAARTAAITSGIKIGGTGSSKLPKPKIAAGHTPGMGMEDNRDSGGPGFAGTPYMIGTGAQPEVFIPDTNGTFIPNADKKLGGGSVYNIVVNNPKKETAENSIRSALKNLSYMGVAA